MVAITFFRSKILNDISSTYAEVYGVNLVESWVYEEKARLEMERGPDVPESDLVHALENRAFAHITQLEIDAREAP